MPQKAEVRNVATSGTADYFGIGIHGIRTCLSLYIYHLYPTDSGNLSL